MGNSNTNNTNDTNKKAIDVHKKYEFGRIVGRGGSGHVVAAIDKYDREKKVAIKILSKQKAICETLYKREIDILSKIEHSNIVKYIDGTEDDINYYILTGLYEGGDLFDRIINPINFEYKITEKMARSLISDILITISYLHSNNIIHRDLKPENFVFSSKEIDSNLILIDFGSAKIVNDDKEYDEENSKLIGTAYYLSPELAAQSDKMVKTGKLLKCSDIWSIGIIAYIMLSGGKSPFKGKTNKEIFYHIINDKLIFPSDIKLSVDFRDFVSKLLIKNPYRRISIDNALCHSWIKGIDSNLNDNIFGDESKLKKAITKCLAKNMDFESENKLRKYFINLDGDCDGYLNVDDLKCLLLNMGFNQNKAIKEAKKLICNDDYIDFNKFKQIWHRKLLSQNDEYIYRVFNIFDNNGDGYIDNDKLQNVLSGDITKMIKEIDENNNNGKLSLYQFKKAMKEN